MTKLNISHKLVSASGLGIFRILFFTIQFFECLQIFNYKELIFDTVVTADSATFSYVPFLLGWLATLIFIIVGYKTKYALVANYAFNLVFFSFSGPFEYHMDSTYTIINFVSMFLPLSLSYSLDSLFDDNKSVPKLNYFYHLTIIFISVALVYFDSIFYKLTSNAWMSGLGFWIPASLPNFTWLDLNSILDQEIIVKTMGYGSLLFESTLIFTMWFSSLRLYLALIGIIFHIGIFLAFPIPFFAFAYCSIYLLLLPNDSFEKCDAVFLRIKAFFRQDGNYKCYSDQNNFKSLSTKSLSYFLIFIFFLQAIAMVNSPFLQKFFPYEIRSPMLNISNALKPFLGITGHGVFLDFHYDLTQNIPIIKYGNEILPIYSQEGHAGEYSRGRLWCNSTFRYLNPSKGYFSKGLEDYTAFWATKNKKGLENLDFELFIKRIDKATSWQEGFLKQQKQKPLIKVANLYWRNHQFKIEPVNGAR
jgi:hypothetical protein